MDTERIKKQVNIISERNYEEVHLGSESGVDISSYADSDIPWFQMEEIRLGLKHGVDINHYLQEGFDWMQVSEIRLGIEHGVDISIYAKQEYVSQQMHEIRIGLENEIDVNKYLNPSYDWFQMEEIRKGLERGDNTEVYADEKYDYLTMRQIRKAMEKGIDLLPYVERGYDAHLLMQIRRCLASELKPDSFLDKGYDAGQLEQIRIAFEKKIDIGNYLSVDMLGNQLEEIMKGIQVGINVSIYAKSEFSWQQMQEIRLGLQAGYDVSGYAESMYSVTEMCQAREKLIQDEENGITILDDLIKEDFAPSFVTISEDGMEAVLNLAMPNGNRKYTEQDILDILKVQGVTLGIDRDVINTILAKELYAKKIVIARGQKAVPGSDGRYEFLFRTELPTKPQILEDGSVDYMHMEYFEQVKQGQKLAIYIPATLGKGGYTVNGKIMVARKGKEKPVLRGDGFVLAEDKCTYISKLNGKVEIQGYRMLVSKLHVIDGDVTYTTGNISFEGDLIVRGCVRSGVTLQAGGVGFIRAKGAVTGKFFESVKIEAEQDIRANYILNCDIATKGKVIVSGRKGILVGGMTRAVQGIDVFDIGNAAQLGTTVEVGLTKKFFEQYNEIEKNVIKTQSETRAFKEGVQKFEKTYTDEQLAEIFVYDKIKLAYEMKTEELTELLAKKAKFEEEMNQMSQAKVVVKGKAYAGIHIIIDRIPLRLTETIPNVTFRHVEDRVAIFRN